MRSAPKRELRFYASFWSLFPNICTDFLERQWNLLSKILLSRKSIRNLTSCQDFIDFSSRNLHVLFLGVIPCELKYCPLGNFLTNRPINVTHTVPSRHRLCDTHAIVLHLELWGLFFCNFPTSIFSPPKTVMSNTTSSINNSIPYVVVGCPSYDICKLIKTDKDKTVCLHSARGCHTHLLSWSQAISNYTK